MDAAAPAPANRVWTVPNILSFLRLLGVPAFLYLLLGPEADGWALGILMASGVTDYLDGYLARKLNQGSRIGALLDPLADRLYILATLVGFVIREVIPLWLALVIVGRDAILALCLPLLKRAGYAPPEVHYLGKAATFCLLYAFPLLLLGTYDNTLGEICKPIAWGFTIWGTGLYVFAGARYLRQVGQLVRNPVA